VTDSLRTPPASLEAESSVLGGLLLNASALERVGGMLTAEDFHRHEHRLVFAAICQLANAGKEADVITVHALLEDQGKAEEAGGLVYLNALSQYVPSAANIRRYAEIVRERAVLRKLVSVADEIATLAYNPQGKTPAEVLDDAQMRLAKMANVKRRRDPQSMDQSLANYLGLLQDLSEGKNPALPTGIAGLDRLLNGGLRRGEVMVIGARPKHGKTALALALARNLARRFSVLFLSQEMPVSQLMHRHTAATGTLDLGRILKADPKDVELWERVSDVARRLGELRLHHDDQCGLSLMDIRRKALQVRRVTGLDALFIDFLQLMQGAGEENRNRELDVIVNGIKGLAMDLDCAVVVLSQMSRKADEHYSPPTMTYLRDSGAIEAAADQIALLFTDHAHPLSPKSPAFHGFSSLDLVAHRNGPTGAVPLQFQGQYQQMADWLDHVPTRQTAQRTHRGMSTDE